MRTDTVEFWDDVWATMEHTFADHDTLLEEHTRELKPGRALELGCGSGGNAVWLAERGWQVTTVDFSAVAIEKAKLRAADHRVEVEFTVSDVTVYRPNGPYDLITSFYIQLWPEQRAQMLSAAVEALAPGGRLLFVSHDQSSPPAGWSREDLESLTTPDEVAAELPSLRIERAEVVREIGAHAEDMPHPEEQEGHSHHQDRLHSHEEPEHHGGLHGAATVVLGVMD